MTVAAFFAAAVAVFFVGPRMARVADRLGEATGLGGALFGALFLALATDLPEVALTVSAGVTGSPRIAVGNLLGSAAAQLVLIAVVDVALRRAQLYRDVALHPTVGQCALMISVLAVPLFFAPANPSVGPVSLGTVALPAAYVGGLSAIRQISFRTEEAPAPESDMPPGDEYEGEPTAALWRRFAALALVLAGAGVALERTTEPIGESLGIGATAAGALLAGVVTSLPELVTAVSAARAGALELAVGDIVGSSALDVVLLALADVAYTDGSIFDLLGPPEQLLIAMALALTALPLVALARREQVGKRPVGVESYLMVAVFLGGAVLLLTTGG